MNNLAMAESLAPMMSGYLAPDSLANWFANEFEEPVAFWQAWTTCPQDHWRMWLAAHNMGQQVAAEFAASCAARAAQYVDSLGVASKWGNTTPDAMLAAAEWHAARAARIAARCGDPDYPVQALDAAEATMRAAKIAAAGINAICRMGTRGVGLVDFFARERDIQMAWAARAAANMESTRLAWASQRLWLIK